LEHPNYITIKQHTPNKKKNNGGKGDEGGTLTFEQPIFFLYYYDDRILPILEILREFVKEDHSNNYSGIHFIVGRSSYPSSIYDFAKVTGRPKEVMDGRSQSLERVTPTHTQTSIRSIYNTTPPTTTTSTTTINNNTNEQPPPQPQTKLQIKQQMKQQQRLQQQQQLHFWNYTPFNQTMTYPYPLEYLNQPYQLPDWCSRTRSSSSSSGNSSNNRSSHSPTIPTRTVEHPEIIGVVTAFDNSPRRPYNEASIYLNGQETTPTQTLQRFETNYHVALYYQKCCVTLLLDKLENHPPNQHENQRATSQNQNPGNNHLLRYHHSYENNRFVVINSWNEWAEGMAIEPSDVYGYQWLEVIQRVKHKIQRISCSRNNET